MTVAPDLAGVIERRLRAMAEDLEAADPTPLLGRLVAQSFPLGAADPRYGDNALAPGALPIEHTFSEAAPATLRFTLEPFGPEAPPVARSIEATRALRELAGQAFGPAVANALDATIDSWECFTAGDEARFGAFLGAAFDAQGPAELKIYYELSRASPMPLPFPPELVAALPAGAAPHLVSIACRRDGVAVRVYWICERGLRLLDLAPLAERAGLGHRLPDLVSTTLTVAGDRFHLPPCAALVGLREDRRGVELKTELLPAALPPEAIRWAALRQKLRERPASLSRLDRLAGALGPRDRGEPGVNAVSVRVSSDAPARLNVYLRVPVR